MKKFWKPLAALLLCLSLLGGCAQGGGTVSQPDVKGTAMGRYVEQEYSFPFTKRLYQMPGFHLDAQGSLHTLCYTYQDDRSNNLDLDYYVSADGGETWEQQSAAWIDIIDGPDSHGYIEAACWDEQGGIYLSITNSGLVETSRSIDYVTPQGELQTLPYELKEGEPPFETNILGMAQAENGDLLLQSYFDYGQLDAKSGQILHLYSPEASGETDGFAVNGNEAAISQRDKIQIIDLTTGVKKEDIPCTVTVSTDETGTAVTTEQKKSKRVLTYGSDGTLYYADSTGLFRRSAGSGMLERLADGALTNLAIPSISPMSLVTDGNTFWVLVWSDEEWKLLRYQYQADVPTIPELELKVYSLYDSPTIRQATGSFQRSNPNVYVSFQVGVSTSSVTQADALRALSAELLAGRGPDILVLDGMPIDDYYTKGLLTDLAPALNASMENGELLSNICGAYRQTDGSLPAIPARFRVPLMMGSEEIVAAASSLPSLADWLEQNPGNYASPLTISSRMDFLSDFYTILADDCVTADNTANREKISELLSCTKRIYNLAKQKDLSWFAANDYAFGALGWMKDSIALHIGSVDSFTDLYAPWQARQNVGHGTETTLLNANMFVPETILGVNAKSTLQEQAAAFIDCVLSQGIQTYVLEDGMPVNSAALVANAALGDRDKFGYYGSVYIDANGDAIPVDLIIGWPPEEFRSQMLETFRGLTNAAKPDTNILQILLSGTERYFKGDRALEETLNDLCQKIDLYLSE